jgi:ubiquinone/menaquinone biosynthesis C-methylase UbiE
MGVRPGSRRPPRRGHRHRPEPAALPARHPPDRGGPEPAVAAKRAADLGRTVELSEAAAEHLPFPDASFDTVVCTLSLCSVADDKAAIAEMYRVLRPGGQLLLLDHVAATNRFLLALQRLWEKVTVRFAEDHQTRHPLPLVEQAGFVVTDSRRSKLGTVERLRAVKPAT